MKKFVLLVIAFASFACVQTQTMEDADVVEVKPHPLTAIWVDYAKSHEAIFNNELSRSKAASIVNEMFLDTLSRNPQLLVGCPVKYEMMSPGRANKYYIKFSLSKYNPQNIQFKEDDTEYNVAVDIFAIVDEDFALSLKERQMYELKNFTFKGDVNKHSITLPSGRRLVQKPSISDITFVDRELNLHLCGILLSDLILEKI